MENFRRPSTRLGALIVAVAIVVVALHLTGVVGPG